MTIGESLREFRQRTQRSQAQLVDEVMTSQTIISAIEGNRPAQTTKEKIEFILDFSGIVYTNRDVRDVLEGTQKKKMDVTVEEKKESSTETTGDPIAPSHYRKGEIDLFESWYRTYPLNEFRAIMEAIAERYMKRDKENRIQDLDKAIYTLERLKEYEESEPNVKN